MTRRPPVVIIGLDCPTGLHTARIFADRGIEVIGLATQTKHPCARTRSCARVIEVPAGKGALVETLVRLGVSLGERAVLVPCSDLAVLDVARNQNELRMLYRFAVPKPDITELLMDKARFAKFATIHEFPIPRTFVVTHRSDIETAAAEIQYPCILKPSIKSAEWSAHTAAKALMIDSAKGLLDSYEWLAPWADSFVVQEWIVGTDEDHYTCDCYVSAQGVPLVTFSARKIRQWPPGTGQGCLSVECRDDYVRDLTLRVLATAGHHGQGYLETKRDTRTGRHLIIEANIGRPTGRAATAERAGVELLMTMYCDLVGTTLPTARTQKYLGTKWIHIRRDLQASAHLMMTGKAGLRDIVKPWKGPFAFALLSRKDPVPFLADFTHAVGLVVRGYWNTARAALGRRKGMRWLAPKAVAESDKASGDEESSSGVPALMRAEQADFDLQGLLRVRTRDAWPEDLATVARHLGQGVRPLAGDPDVVVCFVDELTPHVLERVGDDVGFGDDGVFCLSRSGRPLAHIRLSEPWGSAMIVCRRGLARVPLLSTALDLAALHQEWVPLRAAPWSVGGSAVLVVPARGSQPTPRAAECTRPVPEGRLLLSPDGRATVRVGKPTAIGRTPSGSPERANAALTNPDVIVLLEAVDTPEIVVERIEPEIAAARIAATVADELKAALAQHDTRDAQLAGRGWLSARRAPGVAMRLLREATRWKPCYVVRHPEASTSEELCQAIAAVLPGPVPPADRPTPPVAPIATPRNRRSSSTSGSASTERTRGTTQS
jgi:predicted ATP-grasp superfamily ATP-dependent carboligase